MNYGRREDFEQLRALGVSLNGSIAVARVGGAVSFAEKVWHAQEAGHVGVLIYPDPADVPQDPRRLGLHSNAVISEHVRTFRDSLITSFVLIFERTFSVTFLNVVYTLIIVIIKTVFTPH